MNFLKDLGYGLGVMLGILVAAAVTVGSLFIMLEYPVYTVPVLVLGVAWGIGKEFRASYW